MSTLSATMQTLQPAQRTWEIQIRKLWAELALKALTTPYSESTINLRNLLLGTSVGLGLWLSGKNVAGIEPIKWLTEMSPMVFHVFATLVLVYAFFAYKLSATTDREIHRQQVLVPFEGIRNELRKIQDEVDQHAGNLVSEEEHRGPILAKLKEEGSRREARFERVIKRIGEELDKDPDNLEIYKRWTRVRAWRDREEEAHYLRIKAVWGDVEGSLIASIMLGARASYVNAGADNIYRLMERRRSASKLEYCGVLTISFLTFAWAMLGFVVLYVIR
jgi:hypothetical protein